MVSSASHLCSTLIDTLYIQCLSLKQHLPLCLEIWCLPTAIHCPTLVQFTACGMEYMLSKWHYERRVSSTILIKKNPRRLGFWQIILSISRTVSPVAIEICRYFFPKIYHCNFIKWYGGSWHVFIDPKDIQTSLFVCLFHADIFPQSLCPNCILNICCYGKIGRI